MNDDQIRFLLNNSKHFIKHTSLRCRNIYYAILKDIFKSNNDEEIKESVKIILLNGLADSDEEIRNNILSIWHDSSLVDSTFDLFERVLKYVKIFIIILIGKELYYINIKFINNIHLYIYIYFFLLLLIF